MRPLCLLLCFLCAVVGVARGQVVCEAFAGAPQPCQSFLVDSWSSVATVPSLGVSQEFLHAQMLQPVQESPSTFVSLLDLLTTVHYQCAVAYARVLCLSFFNPCDAASQTPVPVCRSVCLNYLQTCGASAPADLCDQLNPLTGLPLFADVPGCATNGDDFVAAPFVFPCPRPTLYGGASTPDPDTGLPCAAPCKARIYTVETKRQFNDLYITISVLGWISLFATLALIAIYAYYPALRKYPSRLAIFAAVGNLFVDISLVGNSVQDPDDFLCDSDGVALSVGGWCAAAGFFLIFGGMLLATWWWVQVVVMTYNVGLQQYKQRLDKKYEWVFHVYAWTYSLVCALVMTLTPDGDGAGAPGAVPWCQNSYKQPHGLSWGMFQGVIIFYMLTVVIGVVITLGRVLTMGLASSMPKKTLLTFFISIFVFGIWYLATSSGLIALTSYLEDKRDAIRDTSIGWITCWFVSKGDWQDCADLQYRMPYGLEWWIGTMFAATGIVLFIVFIPMNSKARQSITSGASMGSQSGSKGSASSG